MNQQINLYQPIFRRQKKVFSAVAMLQICGLFIVVFMSIYLYGQAKQQPLREQYDKLGADMVQLNLQLGRLAGRDNEAAGSKLLENEITRLENELEKRREMQQLLAGRTLGNSEGMSAYMEAFARQHIQGLWLTKFTVQDGGRNLGLQGKTRSSELVPRYLEKLAGEQVLNGISFNVMQLSRPDEPTNTLDFNVSTN